MSLCTFIRNFNTNCEQVYRNDRRFRRRIDASGYILSGLIIAIFLNLMLYIARKEFDIAKAENVLAIYLPVVLTVFIVANFAVLVYLVTPVYKQTIREMQAPDGEDSSREQPPPLNNQPSSTVDDQQPGPSIPLRVPPTDPNIWVDDPENAPSKLAVKLSKRLKTEDMTPVEGP